MTLIIYQSSTAKIPIWDRGIFAANFEITSQLGQANSALIVECGSDSHFEASSSVDR
jgi:hypothetical protein